MKQCILDMQEKKAIAIAMDESSAKLIISALSNQHGEYCQMEPDIHRFVYETEDGQTQPPQNKT